MPILPPADLICDIEIPDRSQAQTAGDLVRLLVEDETQMKLKNADLAVLRNWRAKVIEDRKAAAK